MKLCVLMPAHWSGRLGGAEIQVRYLLHYLRQTTTHDLFVICRHAMVSEDDGVPIFRINTLWPIARHTYLFDYPSVRHLLRQIAPDVVYTRVGSPLVGYAAQYCRRFRKKLVHHIARLDDVLPRTLAPVRGPLHHAERRIYEYGLRHADIVIAQAHYQAALLTQHFERTRSEVIPNYHPASNSMPVKDSRTRVVLWVANIKTVKRPEVFVELAERCSSMGDTRFVMIGAISDGSYKPLLTKARNLQNFLYAGPASLEEVNRFMDSAHIFVNTSAPIGEGFPNTFIQAWLRGVPVVSLAVNPDQLLDGSHLGICSLDSIDQLMLDVQSLLRDPDRLAQMGAHARRHALQTYGPENLSKIRRLLEQCDSGLLE